MAQIKPQRGVVLVVSLVFLVALTAAGMALMSSSTLDIKMAGATEDKVIATQSILGASDEAIRNQVTKQSSINNFTKALTTYPVDITVTTDVTEAEIDSVLEHVADCPARKLATSVQIFKCNILELKVEKSYGRFDNNKVGVKNGIAQQLLNVGG